MKILVTLRGEFVFDVSALDVISNAFSVSSDGYGNDAKYFISDQTPEIVLIRDEQIITSDKETVAALRKKVEALESQKSAEWLKAYEAGNKIKEMQKEMDAIKALCPHGKEEE